MDYVLAKLLKSKKENGTYDWFVLYRFRNPETGLMEPKKVRKGINRLKTDKEKRHHGTLLATAVNELLKSDWSPFIISEQEKQIEAPLVELLQEYLKTKKSSIRSRSYDHYVYAIHLFQQYLETIKAATIKSNQFTKAMAFGYSDWLLSTKKYSGKSHNNQVSNMKVFFEMMVDRDVLLKNPFKLIKKKPEEKGRAACYSDEQKNEIKKYTKEKGLPMYLFIQWIYYCFVRPNEIMQLQVKHIDFEFKRIQIPAYASKNRKQSSVDIPEIFFKIVKEKYSSVDKEYFLFAKGLLPGPVNILRNVASKDHKKIVDKLNIKGLVLYDWKHKGASDFLLAGNNPYDLMIRMRHHSLEQTMTYLRSLGVSMFDKSKKRKHEF